MGVHFVVGMLSFSNLRESVDVCTATSGVVVLFIGTKEEWLLEHLRHHPIRQSNMSHDWCDTGVKSFHLVGRITLLQE